MPILKKMKSYLEKKIKIFQINPQHTVPFLNDNGNTIADSHAICAYIVGKYAGNDSLYPKDLYQRARVDQRLHYNSSVLWPCLLSCTFYLYGGGVDVPQERIDKLYAAYDTLEALLQDDLYLVNNTPTIADLCLITTVSTMLYFAPITTENYPKLVDWIALVAELPYYEEFSGRLVPAAHEFFDNWRAKNQQK